LPVTEDGRKVFIKFVHNLWGQRRAVKSTRYGIVRVIAEIEHTLSRASESVRDPAVGNREESLGFLDEVRGTTGILAYLISNVSFNFSALPCGVGCDPS
jgi:hypothetical protein